MFERLKKLYNEGKLTREGLYNAIGKGWITEEQFHEIVDTDNITGWTEEAEQEA